MAARKAGTSPAKAKAAPKKSAEKDEIRLTDKQRAALDLWTNDPALSWDEICDHESVGIPRTLSGQRGATLLALQRKGLVRLSLTAKAKTS